MLSTKALKRRSAQLNRAGTQPKTWLTKPASQSSAILYRQPACCLVLASLSAASSPSSPRAVPETATLRRVVGVDVDILCGEIGRPEHAGSGSLVEFDGDRKLPLTDVFVRGGFVKLRRSPPIAANLQISEANIDTLRIDLRP